MVQLKPDLYRNAIIKHTFINSRGGRSINLEFNCNSNKGVFVLSQKKKTLDTFENLPDAIIAFNELEQKSQGQNTKASAIHPVFETDVIEKAKEVFENLKGNKKILIVADKQKD